VVAERKFQLAPIKFTNGIFCLKYHFRYVLPSLKTTRYFFLSGGKYINILIKLINVETIYKR